MIPVHVPRYYLTPDQLRGLHFKPTVGLIQLSEGHEAKFNCSIDIPDARQEAAIAWVKNGQELAGNNQVVINELQTITDGVATLLSTVRYVRLRGETLCGRLIAEIEMSPCTVFQHYPCAASGCWGLLLQTEHQHQNGRV